jgi:flagellar biosynthesis activator protein FlaF
MYRFSYAEALADDPRHSRGSEKQALMQLVEMLRVAEGAGPQSRAAIDALFAFNTIWSAILEDLVDPANDLPVDVKGRLVSIGIFLIKEAELVRSGRSTNFAALRDVTMTIAEGLA